ncbi:MAG: hypothetical protein KAX49_18410 [Halanaerobiales bacterium]|nr:hypothetical protein [Halanaerobiales bacterium]
MGVLLWAILIVLTAGFSVSLLGIGLKPIIILVVVVAGTIIAQKILTKGDK